MSQSGDNLFLVCLQKEPGFYWPAAIIFASTVSFADSEIF